MKNKQQGFVTALLIIIILLIISGGVYVYFQNKKETPSIQSEKVGTTYINTKFGYQMNLPEGWEFYKYSKDYSIAQQSLSIPEFKNILTDFSTLEEIVKKNPALAESYKKYYDLADQNWSLENTQYIIFTKGDQTPGKDKVFGPDKINLAITYKESDYLDGIENKKTDSEIIEKFVTSKGYKGFTREVLTPNKTGVILVIQFDGNGIMIDGKKGNTLMFTLSRNLDKNLLLNIANSLSVE